jgi:hypothetical protein
MSSREHLCAHSTPNVTGTVGLPLSKHRHYRSKCRAKPARTAAVIFGKATGNSLLRRKIPCSGNENSLFRKEQGISRTLFKPLGDFAPVSVKTTLKQAKFV